MEIIKTIAPLTECMDDSLTNEQLKSLNEMINKAIDDPSKNNVRAIKEAINPDEAFLLGYAGVTVAVLLAGLVAQIKNKYRLTVKKLYVQSKELNDVYTKITDLLKHDKMARFKHRNDLIDAKFEVPVMRDKKDPRKEYDISYDLTAYNPEYFIKEINSIINFASKEAPDKRDEQIKSMVESLLKEIDDSHVQNHWYVENCEPLLKVKDYRNLRLENVIMTYKDNISTLYNIIYIVNRLVNEELNSVNILQLSYNKCINSFHGDKVAQAEIDKVFKKLIEYTKMSMDFNGKTIVLMEEIMRFYVDELTKIYDILRS